MIETCGTKFTTSSRNFFRDWNISLTERFDNKQPTTSLNSCCCNCMKPTTHTHTLEVNTHRPTRCPRQCSRLVKTITMTQPIKPSRNLKLKVTPSQLQLIIILLDRKESWIKNTKWRLWCLIRFYDPIHSGVFCCKCVKLMDKNDEEDALHGIWGTEVFAKASIFILIETIDLLKL